MCEYFPDISPIPYKPDGAADELCFRHYNPDEILDGKSMKEWLKFSVCYWHTFRGTGMDPFGAATLERSWEQSNAEDNDPMQIAKRRVDAAFELFTKLGVEYYTFHD